MGKTVIKDTFREIKGSFGRFFAIFAIVAIGVSFFAGITASSSDMRYSSDSYYDEYNLFDLRLLSDAGFTDDDIKAIRETDGVKGVFAAHEADVLTTIGNAQVTVRVMGVPEKIVQMTMKIILTGCVLKRAGSLRVTENVWFGILIFMTEKLILVIQLLFAPEMKRIYLIR